MEADSSSPEALRNGSHDARSSEISPTSHENGSSNEAAIPKTGRSRACVSCRAMKIKCRWPDSQDACVACAKVSRECVMPGPPKKRQKNKHKFAELEQKINALTEALTAKANHSVTPPNEVLTNKESTESHSESVRTESHSATAEQSSFSTYPGSIYGGVLSAQWKGVGCEKPLEISNSIVKAEDYVDIIDQGKVDLQTACKMFNHWQMKMHPYFPLVVLPPHVKAEDVRIARPMLFLAVLAVSSPTIQPDIHAEIVYEFNKEIPRRVLFYGEKSLDLVQAMLTYVKNYSRPRYAKDLVFNQYIHSAAVMCLDLGIGKRSTTGSVQNPIEEAEIRRTWVGTYHVGSSCALLLRHPMLLRFTPYVEECIEFLLTSSYAAPSDKWLCSICRLQSIAEDVSITFGIDDQTSSIAFSDPKTLHHLKMFEQQLFAWKHTVPDIADHRLVTHLQSSLNLYMHEIAIHHGQVVAEQSKAHASSSEQRPFSQRFTAAHIDALSTCLVSCHKVLESWLALGTETARCIPNLYIVWDVYAMVSLIKIHGIIHTPNSGLVDIFAPDLKVEYYLDAMITKLAETALDGKCPQAEGFGYVFKKLMSWYGQRKGPMYSEQLFSSMEASRTQKPEYNHAMSNMAKSLAQKLEVPGSGSSMVTTNTPPVGTTSDLNAAFNAANYNLNWEDLNFSADELNAFDEYMNDPGWLGYLM